MVTAGARWFRDRLWGQLAVTRALGDHQFKKNGLKDLIAEPHIKKITLTSEDKYLVIACDGVWDVISD